MKMHLRPILCLLGGIIVTFGMVMAFDYFRASSMLRDLSQENMALLEDREMKNAENLFVTAENAVKASLERGEMEKFVALLKAQRKLRGVQEFSLFSQNGEASYSADASFLKQKLPEELRGALLRDKRPITIYTNGSICMYRPQAVQADCLRCHLDWKESDSGGVLYCRFSADSLAQSKMQWTKSMAALKRNEIRNGTLTGIVVVVLFGTVAVFAMHRFIGGPLGRATEQLIGASQRVNVTSDHLTTASRHIAKSANEQAAALEETSVALEQLAGITKNTAEHAHRAAELAGSARGAAETGSDGVTRMNVAMQDVKAGATNVAKIIKTINEIAFQTKILALNASVEAARAGEAGLGFAVVAQEIGNLAQRCAKAATETAEQIEDSIRRSHAGVEVSAEIVASFDEIMRRVREVDELMSQIAGAAKEQSLGIEKLNHAMRGMDSNTQSNAANAEQSAGSAQELRMEAAALGVAVAELESVLAGRDLREQRRELAKLPDETGRRVLQASSGNAAVINNRCAVASDPSAREGVRSRIGRGAGLPARRLG